MDYKPGLGDVVLVLIIGGFFIYSAIHSVVAELQGIRKALKQRGHLDRLILIQSSLERIHQSLEWSRTGDHRSVQAIEEAEWDEKWSSDGKWMSDEGAADEEVVDEDVADEDAKT